MLKILLIVLSVFISSLNLNISRADDNHTTKSDKVSVVYQDYGYSLLNARSVFFNYHKDPGNFGKAINILDSFLVYEPYNVNALLFLSRVWLTYGHYIEGDSPEKWERFKNGSEIAQRAIDLSPRNADAYFYYVANEASLAKSKGMFGSFFLVSKLKKGLEKALRFNPNHAEAIAMKGAILYSIPGFMGGDIKESERLIRASLNIAPNLTSTKIFLAKNLYKQKHYDEAIQILSEIINEKNPEVEADWYLNKRVAIKMIKKINDIKHKES